MRVLLASCAAALSLAPSVAAGERAGAASASGSGGAGMFGSRPATTVDAGIDLAGDDYAIGFGARLRWLAGEGFRSEDWDEPSELAALVRYLVHRREHGDVQVALAAGELGGVRLGHGAVFDRYAAGLHVDHRRLGAQLRVDAGRVRGEALVDDVVGPRVTALRGAADLGALELGASVAADLAAPRMDEPSAAVVIGAADVGWRRVSGGGAADGRLHAEAVGIAGVGAGLHGGAAGNVALADGAARLGARAELRLGSSGYLPGWFGPLYERDRRLFLGDRAAMRTQLDVARAGGLGGLGAAGELEAAADTLGSLALGWSHRAGLPSVASARLSAPHFRDVQAAFWGVAEIADGAVVGGALAAELRAGLPRNLFVALEAARLYHDRDGALTPLWITTASVGATLER